MKKEFIKKHKMGLFVVLSAVVMLLGLSYAWLQLTLNGTKDLTLTAGSLVVELDDTMAGGINMSGTYPLTMEEGKATEAYTFTLTNKGTIDSDYTIYLDDVALATGETRISDSNIRYYLTKDGNDKSNALLSTTGTNPNRILDTGKIGPNKKYTYTLRLWIDSSAGNEVMNKSLKTKIRVEAMQGKPGTAVDTLLEKTNPVEVVDYNAGNKSEMFTFTHTAGEQQAGYTSDELTDYRYIGNTPNNYVTFNNEVWRIIGIFTVENERGVKEKRIKIVRDESIGDLAWDSTNVNEWSTATLNKVLNTGDYYNRTGTYVATGLSEEAKKMVGDTKWWLGGSSTGTGHSGPTYYSFERGTTVYSGRSISWVGKIGLIYPSDYAYTYANGVDNKCYVGTPECVYGIPTEGWLYNNQFQCLLSPSSAYTYQNFHVDSKGNLNGDYFSTDSEYGTRPSLYLTSNTQVGGGDGSSTNPYTLK